MTDETEYVPLGPHSPDDSPIDEFELTSRMQSAFKNAGLLTAGMVRRATDSELLHLENFGKLSLRVARMWIGPHNPDAKCPPPTANPMVILADAVNRLAAVLERFSKSGQRP